MNNKITDKDLLDRGFHTYNFDYDIKAPEGTIAAFQKRYDRRGGKGWFLTIYKLAPLIAPDNRVIWESAYQMEAQLYEYGTHNAVNMTFLMDTVDEVENFVFKLFDADIIENYEDKE